jgi:hypothetical protein
MDFQQVATGEMIPQGRGSAVTDKWTPGFALRIDQEASSRG